MSGTTLIYNGVMLRDCETKTFSQSVQYDPSGTDVIFSRFRVRVRSMLVTFDDYNQDHESTIRIPSGMTQVGTIAQRIRRVQTLLGQKGKLFYLLFPATSGNELSIDPGIPSQNVALMAIGAVDAVQRESESEHESEEDGSGDGSEYTFPEISSDPFDLGAKLIEARSVVDPDNGPKPRIVEVSAIHGGRAMEVHFEIDVCRKLCDPQSRSDPYPFTEPTLGGSGEQPSPGEKDEREAARAVAASREVIGNRWSLSESKDARWITTRTLQGELRVANKLYLPHAMRHLIVPPLMRGYQRTGQSFATDPTDLTLKYRIEDRQRAESPPDPAIEWSGYYVEAASEGGAMQTAELSVRLVGPPNVDKQKLIGAAGLVVNSRIRGIRRELGDDPEKAGVRLLASSVVELLGEPVIELKVQVQHATADHKSLALCLDRIGQTLDYVDPNDPNATKPIDGYDPLEWPVPLPYDSESPAGVFACYLQDPCSQWHGVAAWEEFRLGSFLSGGRYPDRPGRISRDEDRLDDSARPHHYASNTVFNEEDRSRIDEDIQYAGKPYTHVRIRSIYQTRAGHLALPYAGVEPPKKENDEDENEEDDKKKQNQKPTTLIVRIHGGLCHRTFEMEATRSGGIPQVPAPVLRRQDPNGINEYLTTAKIRADMPKLGPDGQTHEYRVLAKYVYVLDRPPDSNEKFRIAVNPIESAGAKDADTPFGKRYVDGQQLFSEGQIEWQA